MARFEDIPRAYFFQEGGNPGDCFSCNILKQKQEVKLLIYYGSIFQNSKMFQYWVANCQFIIIMLLPTKDNI